MSDTARYTGTWHAHGTIELATELATGLATTNGHRGSSMDAGSAASRRDGCKDADAVADAVARRRAARSEEDEGAACAWAGAGRSGATVTEAARRREDGRSWRQIAAVWMHDGGDVPTERGKLASVLAWRDIFRHRYDLPIYFW